MTQRAPDWRDVDLQTNPYLRALQSTTSIIYPYYLEVAKKHGLILIPPATMLPKSFDREWTKQHILIPNPIEEKKLSSRNNNESAQASSGDSTTKNAADDENACRSRGVSATGESSVSTDTDQPSLWRNLQSQLVQITGGYLYLPADGTGQPRARILFEELHYDDDFNAFRVLCLDHSMAMSDAHKRQPPSSKHRGSQSSNGVPSSPSLTSSTAPIATISSTAHLTGSNLRPESRNLNDHRDVLTRVLGEVIATRCVFASPRLDFFFTDFSLKLTVVAKQPEKAAAQVFAACSRCLQESIQAIKDNKKPGSTSTSGTFATTSATAKSLATWPDFLYSELEIAIQCHVSACLHSKVFSTLTKIATLKQQQDAFNKTLAALGKVSLFDVGVSPHLVGLCDPRLAVDQMKLLNTFVTPLERLACLQKVESLLLDSMTQSTKQRDRATTHHPPSPSLAAIVAAGSPMKTNAISVAKRTPSKPSSISSSPTLIALPGSPTTHLIVNTVTGSSPADGRSRSASKQQTTPAFTDAMTRLDLGTTAPSHDSTNGHATGIPPTETLATVDGATSPRATSTSSILSTLNSASTSSTSTSLGRSQSSSVSIAASILASTNLKPQTNGGLASVSEAHPSNASTTLTHSVSVSVKSDSTQPPLLSPSLNHASSTMDHATATTALSTSPHTHSNVPASRPRRRSASHAPVSVSADDLLPLLVYVIMESQPANVHANIEYMRHFSPPASLLSASVHSELHYRLANFEAAVSYIETGKLQQQMSLTSTTKPKIRKRMSSISGPATQSLHFLLTPTSTTHRNLFRRASSMDPGASNGSAANGATSPTSKGPNGPPQSHENRVIEGDESLDADGCLPPSTTLDHTHDGGEDSVEHSMFDTDDVEGLDEEDEDDLAPFVMDSEETPNGFASEGEIDYEAVFSHASHRLRSVKSADPITIEFKQSGLGASSNADHLFGSPILDSQLAQDVSSANPLPAWLTDEQDQERQQTIDESTTSASVKLALEDVATTTTLAAPITSLKQSTSSNTLVASLPPGTSKRSSFSSDQTLNSSVTRPPVNLIPLRSDSLDEDDPLGAMTKIKTKKK